jgi:iron(III) transport system substrate-binding protein
MLLTLLVGFTIACAPTAPSPTAAPAAKPAAPVKEAAPAAGVQKAKQEAEAKGFKFVASHDEIADKARQEGSLRALISLEKDSIKALKEGFASKYPFINFELQEIAGTQSTAFVLELKAGNPGDWDSAHVTPELYPEFPPLLEKYDLLGMAEAGVLKIEPKMIDPANRTVMAAGTAIAGFTYNRNLLPADKAPKTWEDFLKPEFKGRKFAVDIEPSNLASLLPLKGEQWVLDYARKLAAQDPVWVRGDTRTLTALAGGEYGLHFGSNFHSAMRIKERSPDIVEVVVPDPIPVRLTQPVGIILGAKRPHAALLFYEYLASPEGQKIMDDVEFYKSSMYVPGGKIEQFIRGKQASVLDWQHVDKRGSYEEKITKEWGFPKAEGAK